MSFYPPQSDPPNEGRDPLVAKHHGNGSLIPKYTERIDTFEENPVVPFDDLQVSPNAHSGNLTNRGGEERIAICDKRIGRQPRPIVTLVITSNPQGIWYTTLYKEEYGD
jgi:hypothetical protein